MIKYDVEVYDDGAQVWFKDGKCHCEHGPAVTKLDGFTAYMIDGEYHREDGPAIIDGDGSEEYYLNGERMSKEEHARRTSPTVEMTVAEISKLVGKNVKVVE